MLKKSEMEKLQVTCEKKGKEWIKIVKSNQVTIQDLIKLSHKEESEEI